MSKGVRWTFYITVTVAIIVSGWYLSLHERPDRYTPRETPYSDTSPVDGSSETPQEAEEGTDGWSAQIVGRVQSTHPMTSEDRELFSIELVYTEEPHFEGELTPEIDSPVNLVGSQEMFESRLGRLPEFEDELRVKTEAREKAPLLLPVQHVEFAEDVD